MELPMPSFWSFKKPTEAHIANQEKINKLDAVDEVMEGGEIDLELRPASAAQDVNSDDDIDIFANSATSFMSERMRLTAEQSF